MFSIITMTASVHGSPPVIMGVDTVKRIQRPLKCFTAPNRSVSVMFGFERMACVPCTSASRTDAPRSGNPAQFAPSGSGSAYPVPPADRQKPACRHLVFSSCHPPLATGHGPHFPTTVPSCNPDLRVGPTRYHALMISITPTHYRDFPRYLDTGLPRRISINEGSHLHARLAPLRNRRENVVLDGDARHQHHISKLNVTLVARRKPVRRTRRENPPTQPCAPGHARSMP